MPLSEVNVFSAKAFVVKMPGLFLAPGHSGSDLAEQRRLACEKFLQAAAKIPAVMKSSVWWDFFSEEVRFH